MKASADSRCASSELKGCVRPSSVDLRAQIAQCTICCSESVWLAGLLTRTATPLSRTQSEKAIPVPLGSGHLASDGAERFVSSLAVLKAALQHGDADRVILIRLDENRARRGDTGIGRRRSRKPK